jgi:hypothetical protein
MDEHEHVEYITIRLLGADAFAIGAGAKPAFVAEMLYCAAHQYAFESTDSTAAYRTTLDEHLGRLMAGELLHLTPAMKRTYDALELTHSDIRRRVSDIVQTLAPLSAIRRRTAYLLTTDSFEGKVRVLKRLPHMLPDSLDALTVSNRLHGLASGAIHTNRVYMIGSTSRVGSDVASQCLEHLARSFERVMPSLDKLSTQDAMTTTLVVPDLAVVNNLVMFHIPDQAVRTKATQTLLATAGIRLKNRVRAVYTVPAAAMDLLNYHAMRLPLGTMVEDEWVNTAVSLIPPVHTHGYADALARIDHGIRLLS